MNWWMVLLGVVMIVPASLLVIGLYVGWLIRALDLFDDRLRRTMTSNEEGLAVMFWVIHSLALSVGGVALLLAGFGA